MDDVANIRKQMEKHDKYSIPTEHLKVELAKVENKQKEFPANLKLDRIALTLWNKIPLDERFESDEEDHTPTVTINRVSTRSQSNSSKDKQENDSKYSRYNKHNNKLVVFYLFSGTLR